MTYYEWIRICILLDAEKHPIPKICRRRIIRAIRRKRRTERLQN